MNLPVLMYHRVAIPANDDPFGHLCVTPKRFAEQLDLILRRGFMTVGGNELTNAVATGSCPITRPCAITFDDGTTDLYENALPLLIEKKVKAIIFLVAGLADKRSAWLARPDNPEPPAILSWEMVREMAAAGIEFGAHTMSHPRLSQLSEAEARCEITDSKKRIEDETGKEISLFCYPYGDYNQETISLVKEVGFSAAFTTRRGTRHQPEQIMEIARVPVHDGVTPLRLAYRLSWLYRLKYGNSSHRRTAKLHE